MELQKIKFWKAIIPLCFILSMLAGIYSCSNPSDTASTTGIDPGIMWTDETGRIEYSHANDYSDWCYDTLISSPPAARWGAAYPNGTDSLTKINFRVMETDTISMYFLKGRDSLFVIHEEVFTPGFYEREINMYSFNFPSSYQRIYFKNRRPMSSPNKPCNKYGDILFRPRH